MFFLSQIGQAVALVLPVENALKVFALVAAKGVIVDTRAILRGSMSIGWRRQTAKSLALYRVSFTSWLVLLSAVLGIAPSRSGAVYGLFFAVPLIISVSAGDVSALGKRAMDRWWHSVRYAQALGVLVMVAISGWMASAWLL
ncbi:hypothetical protein [Nonomuraea sp. C10]|uniref:hypothetical protein n=1 Tax=Nonomuraea sp. C10 TaxID=2600577 RepID=UPI0011CEA729|nr:hypothetical protein [Nonomuraea sp. C10]TXK34253.1 hypothetical protein FR742_33225 [Nonomuraea sp. C10]